MRALRRLDSHRRADTAECNHRTRPQTRGDAEDLRAYHSRRLLAVRAVLRGLTQKQLVTHRYDGPLYVYAPAVPAERERLRALGHLVRTFFGGSAEDAAAALLGMEDVQLSDEAIQRLTRKIEDARREGR